MEGFVPAFKTQLKSKLDALHNRLVEGRCDDFAAYKQLVGEIHGLEQAIQFLSEAVKNCMEEEETYDEEEY